MAVKKITIETSSRKYNFEVDEYNGKYTLYDIDYTSSFFNSKRRNKVGETKSLQDAIMLAKSSVDGNIKNTQID
jgi:hypothetical protein